MLTDTSVVLTSGVLTITDANGGNSNDQLQISYAAGVYTITDTGGLLLDVSSIAGSTGDGTSMVTVPDTGVTGMHFDLLGGDDSIIVNSVQPVFSGDFIISGGTGTDSATINGDIATSGMGAVNISVSRSIELHSGASITSVDGNISLSANQQETATSGDFVGITVNNALIQATGTGAVTVSGKGGDAATGSQTGVLVSGGSDIVGGTTGPVQVTGQGGGSSGTHNYGVNVSGSGSTISSAGAAVNVTGTGGGVDMSAGNFGVFVDAGGQITAGGNAAVIVTGTGGSTPGSFNFGVNLVDSGSAITSGGGAVQVVGIEGGGTSNIAIRTGPGSSISTLANGGDISLIGDTVDIDSTSSISSDLTSFVYLRPRTNGRSISLGRADSAFTLGLTDAELDRITAGTLQIGDSNAGTIGVTQPITHGNNLYLVSAAQVSVNAAVSMAPSKAFTAHADADNNGSGTFAVVPAGQMITPDSVSIVGAVPQSGGAVGVLIDGNISPGAPFVGSTTGDGVALRFGFNSPRTLSTIWVDNGSDQTAPGQELTQFTLTFFDAGNNQIGSPQTLTLPGNNGALELAHFPAVANVSFVHMTNLVGKPQYEFREVRYTQVNDSSVTTSGGPVTITAADVNLTRTINAPGAVVSILANPGRQIDLGTETSGKLSLTDAELERITADTLIIGDTNSGDMLVSQPITHGNNLLLSTGGNLVVAGGVTMATDRVFHATSTGSTFVQAGITTMNGSLSLSADGDLAINAPLSSGGGQISLVADADGNGAGTYSQALPGAIPNDAVLHWKLDESPAGSGKQIVDSSGNGNHGTLSVDDSNAAATGIRNGAIDFDGFSTADRVTLSSPTAWPTADFTVSLWVQTSQFAQSGIFSYASTGSANDLLIARPNNLEVWVAGQLINTGQNIANGSWNNVVVTRAGSFLRLYVNGVQVYSGGVTSTLITGDGVLMLGQEQDAVGGGLDALQAFDGLLDEVAVFSRALSATEVSDIYQASVSSGGGDIQLSAANVTLDGIINAGAGKVTVSPTQGGREVSLGTEVAGKLSLTNLEQNRLIGGTLEIGSSTSGPITVSTLVSRNTNLVLTTPTGINLNANVRTDGGATSAGSLTLNGPVALGADVTLDTDHATGTDGAIIANGLINLGARTLTHNAGSATNSTATDITGTGGSLIKTGPGTLALNGVNTYTGATIVSEGTLLVNGVLTGGTGVTVHQDATLGGTGNIEQTVTPLHGTISPGTSPGVLNFAAGLDLSPAFDSVAISRLLITDSGALAGGVQHLSPTFTAPQSGAYTFYGEALALAFDLPVDLAASIRVDGALVAFDSTVVTLNTVEQGTISYSIVLNLTAGQTVDVRFTGNNLYRIVRGDLNVIQHNVVNGNATAVVTRQGIPDSGLRSGGTQYLSPTFTAPQTGSYAFSGEAYVQPGTSTSDIDAIFRVNGVSILSDQTIIRRDPGQRGTLKYSVVLDLTAGQTVDVRFFGTTPYRILSGDLNTVQYNVVDGKASAVNTRLIISDSGTPSTAEYSSPTFTAPQSGFYSFFGEARVAAGTSPAGVYASIRVDETAIPQDQTRVSLAGNALGTITYSAALYLTAGQTVDVRFAGQNPRRVVHGDLNVIQHNAIPFEGTLVAVEIDGDQGAGAVNGHDQANVTGAVNIAGATLALDLADLTAGELSPGQSFVIINNDAADPVNGTFSGLAEGATVATNVAGSGLDLAISYVGGDGNDVVLTVLSSNTPPAIALDNVVNSILELTILNVSQRVADIVLTDDGMGTNTVSLTGLDAAYFELANGNTELHIKAGTVLDFESKSSYSVRVQVDDASIGGSPDAFVDYILNVIDVPELPEVDVTLGGNDTPSGSGVTFGDASQGGPGTSRTFMVTNSGIGDLILQPIQVPAGFALSTPNFMVNQVLAPGASTFFSVQMSTAAAGVVSGVLTFATNDSTVSEQNYTLNLSGAVIAPTASPTVVSGGGLLIDNGDAGFFAPGNWTTFTAGYAGDGQFARSNDGPDRAIWAFGGLSAGLFQTYITWQNGGDKSDNVTVTIRDGVGGPILSTSTIAENVAPLNHRTEGGRRFQRLDTVAITGNALVVELVDNGTGKTVVADAVLIVPFTPPPATPEITVREAGDLTDGGNFTFASVTQGNSASATFTVRNDGTADIILQPISVTGAAYSIRSGTNFTANQVLTPGNSVQFIVDLNTANAGTFNGTLSIPNNDSNEGPFDLVLQATVNPLGATSFFIDDGDPAGFALTGNWASVTTAGYLNDAKVIGVRSSGTATWTFGGLTAGQYQISTTWLNGSDRATAVNYVIRDGLGGPILATVPVNQRNAPTGTAYGGRKFDSLGTVDLTGNTLVVEVSNAGANGAVIADAVRIESLTPPPDTPDVDVKQGTLTVLDNGLFSVGTAFQGDPQLQKVFTVKNTGTANLTLEPISLTGAGFTLVSANFTSGQILAPNATATFTIGLATTSLGNFNGTVTFATNDGDENPFNFDLTGEVKVAPPAGVHFVDDGDAGLTTTGVLTSLTSTVGYSGDFSVANAANGMDTARWEFNGLEAGQYDVALTWQRAGDRATAVTYVIRDGIGGAILDTVVINQTLAPVGFTDGGRPFQVLTNVAVTSSLVIEMSTAGTTGVVVVDAARIQRTGNLAVPGVIAESASLGLSTTFGFSLNSTQWAGMRFHLDSPAEITEVGGNIGGTGTLFAAIFDSDALATVAGDPFLAPPLAVTTLTAGSPSSDIRVPLDVQLSMGDYVFVIGTGAFGATGTGNIPARFQNQVANPEVTTVSWNPALGWGDILSGSASYGMRFVVEGIA